MANRQLLHDLNTRTEHFPSNGYKPYTTDKMDFFHGQIAEQTVINISGKLDAKVNTIVTF